jgi:hypothetical protein
MDQWIRPGQDEGAHLQQEEKLLEESLELESNIMSIEHEAFDKRLKDQLSKKFINLLGQGYKPGEAAKLVGTSIRGIMNQNKFKKDVQLLVETYNLPPDIRRAMVRAGMNQIVMENLKVPEATAQKLALDALKAIGSDTEVGINAPPQPGIQINLGNLTDVFAAFAKDDKMVVIDHKETEDGDSEAVLDAATIQLLAPETSEEETNKV